MVFGRRQTGYAPRTMKRKFSPTPAEALLLALYAASAILAWIVIWRHLNLLQIDAAGHLASARMFREGFFHTFTDTFFLGYVHGLFYPPMEDLLLTLASFLTGGDFVLAYRLYLSCLLPVFLAVLAGLAFSFRRGAPRLFALAFFLYLFHVDKPELLDLQGLSSMDVFITGLSAETLGGVFFVLLLRHLLLGKHHLAGILVALTLLSHLVIGPVAFLTLLVWAFTGKRLALLREAGWTLGLVAFFLLPAVAYRGFLFSSTIYREPPVFLFLMLGLAAVLLLRDRRGLPLALTGFILALPQEVYGIAAELGIVFPDYHYYRLLMPATILLGAALAAFWERVEAGGAETGWSLGRRVVLGLVVFLAFFLLRDHPPHLYDFDSPAYRHTEVPEIDLPPGEGIERVHVIHLERASDFYLDSLAFAQGSEALFSKGLFWESSRNNPHLTSYLATTLSTDNQVLDYWYFKSAPCDLLRCFLDHFIRDNALGRFLVAELGLVSYIDAERQECYASTLEDGTEHFRFEKTGDLIVKGTVHRLYDVLPRGGEMTKSGVEVVAAEAVRFLDPIDRHAFAESPSDTFAACREGTVNRRVYFHAEEEGRLRKALDVVGPAIGGSAAVKISIERLGRGEYALEIDSPEPVLFRVKLNYYPGFELLTDGGEELEIYDGLGHISAIGHGRMTLRHRRTPVMWTGYLVSLAVLVALIGKAAVARSRTRRKTAA